MSDSAISSKDVTLPTWASCKAKAESGKTLSALEQFVYDNEPVPFADEECLFRTGLFAVVKELSGDSSAPETSAPAEPMLLAEAIDLLRNAGHPATEEWRQRYRRLIGLYDHLQDLPETSAPREAPYWVQGFWSPCKRYLVTVCVSETDISVLDDNGTIWKETGPREDMADPGWVRREASRAQEPAQETSVPLTELQECLASEGAKDYRIEALEAALDWALPAVFEHYAEGEAPKTSGAYEEIEKGRARVLAELERLRAAQLSENGKGDGA